MLVMGKNAVRDLLKGTRKIFSVTVVESFQDKDLINEFKRRNLKVVTLNKKSFSSKFGEKAGGIVCECQDFEYKTIEELIDKTKNHQESVVLILDNLEDPHNLGAILRSADATGCDGIIIPKNRSVEVNETVVKVSTGAYEHVDVCKVTNLNQTIEKLKEAGFWVIGLELTGTMDYKDADYSGKCCLVVGSEGKGISPLVQKNCDLLVKIPMFGKVNSLNASVSAGLILYEAIRKRGVKNK